MLLSDFKVVLDGLQGRWTSWHVCHGETPAPGDKTQGSTENNPLTVQEVTSAPDLGTRVILSSMIKLTGNNGIFSYSFVLALYCRYRPGLRINLLGSKR